MKKINKEEIKQEEPKINYDLQYAYDFLCGRPTNLVTYFEIVDFAQDYQKRTGHVPSLGVIVNNFTTEKDKEMYQRKR